MRLFLSILLFSTIFYAQEYKQVDSLKNVVKSSSNDSVKMISYNKLRRLTYYSDADASKKYTEKYLEYARKLKDSHNIVLAHYFLGNAELLSGSYKVASDNYLIGANYYEQKKDTARLTSVLNALGAVYEKTENDSLSLVYYQKGKTLAELIGDKRRAGIAGINIGNIYTRENEIKKAITYYEEAVNNLEINPNHISFLKLAEINLANSYQKAGESEKAQKVYLETLEKIDTVSEVYNYGLILKGLSSCYLDLGENKKALESGKKAYTIFEQNSFKDEQFQMMPELITLYRKNNRPENALELYDAYQVKKDSLLKESNNQQITSAIQKYEVAKKDAQLKVLSLEKIKANQQRQLYLNITVFVIILAVLIGFFLYKNNKKNKLLTKQKRLLETTLDEKNILLKEIHHRVKNSFQVVSSLLYMQSETVKDDVAKNAIKEAENRIRSMVIIHQKLYNKDELVGINTSDYFRDLVTDITESHNYDDKTIAYNFDVDELVLDIETITPLGLVLNELIVNAIKHAFTDINTLYKLDISFKMENNILVLKVKDNGHGFVSKTDKDSFGILLMNALCKKLKAILTYDKDIPSGTVAIVNIKKFNIIS